MARRKKTFGTSLSWKRASGLSAAKGKLSRKIGIPLTRSGRQRKFGAAAGCLVPIAIIVAIVAMIFVSHHAFAQVSTENDLIPVTKGSISKPKYGYITQYVSVVNNTGKKIHNIIVECGFFSETGLVASNKGMTSDVFPGQTAFVEVAIPDQGNSISSTQCRAIAR